MTALTANAKREWRPADTVRVEVQAGAHVRQGSLVEVDADGRVAPATKAAGKTYFGWALSEGDNTAGAAGDVNIVVRRRGAVRLRGKPGESIDVGDLAYVEDDDTVSITSGGNTRLGRVVDTVTGSTDVFVELDVAGR